LAKPTTTGPTHSFDNAKEMALRIRKISARCREQSEANIPWKAAVATESNFPRILTYL